MPLAVVKQGSLVVASIMFQAYLNIQDITYSFARINMFGQLLSRFGLVKATIITTLMVVTTSFIIAFVANTLIGRQFTSQTFLLSILVPLFVASPFIYNHFTLLLKLITNEKILEISAADYKNLIDNIPGIVYRGKLDWSTEIISETQEICGYTESEINSLEKGWLDVVHPDDIDAMLKGSNKLSLLENSLTQNYRIITKDGAVKWVQDCKKSFFSEDGEFLGVEGVIFDITERHKLEEGLQHAHKLESIGLLAGGIAHDFNNILTAILGNINLALLDSKLGKDTKKLLLKSEKASKRATGLTQQLLVFSKGGEPIKETASIESIIKDSANFVLQGDNTTCSFDFPKPLWLVAADKGQISQVIQNVVLNASHAMPEGGTVKIACENVNLSDNSSSLSLGEGKYVKLCIRDNGIGMPENILERIFDPYFTTKDKGSGLGLAISHSIINKHQGEILVESSSGIGTTFTIYLPASEKSELENPAPLEKEPSFSKARVLIMDDDEMVRDVTKEMLEKLGHEVFFASEGREAIKSYKDSLNSDNRFDLIIMDLTVPGGMGGNEATQRILDLDKEAKIIVASGYSNDPVMANYKKHGFCGTINKPFNLARLRTIIGEVLS